MSTDNRGPNDGALLRELNRQVVVDLVRDRGPVSRAEIAKSSGLAKPTVSVIVGELVAEGALRALGMGEAARAGGRRPLLFDFNPRSQVVLGVHVGVEETVVALADAVGAEVARAVLPTPPGDPSAAVEAVNREAHRLLREARVPKRRLAAVGVCVPGLVDPVTGVCLLAPNLGWRNVDVGRALGRLGAPVHVHNVMQGVLVAEHLEGAAKDTPNAALLYEDNGVGAAMLDGGRIFHGARGVAGELGHCKIPGAKSPCNCGGVGCLETTASARPVRTRARGIPVDPSETRVFAALAASPSKKAARLLREVGEELGYAASWLVNLVNPDTLVVAGAFVDGGEVLCAGIEAALRRHALPEAAAMVDVRLSQLGRDAPVRGAVLLAREAVTRR